MGNFTNAGRIWCQTTAAGAAHDFPTLRWAGPYGVDDRRYTCGTVSITVGHYPSGVSKGNLIEQRLLSAISKTWAGWRLRSFELVRLYIADPTTHPGLRVRAHLVPQIDVTGRKVSDEAMAALNIHPRASARPFQ